MLSRCDSSGYPADALAGERVECPSCHRLIRVEVDSFGAFLIEHEEPVEADDDR